jgi:hypothetical protein
LGQCLYFTFSTHKQRMLSHKYIQNNITMFFLKPYTLAGFEPGSVVSEADAMGEQGIGCITKEDVTST